MKFYGYGHDPLFVTDLQILISPSRRVELKVEQSMALLYATNEWGSDVHLSVTTVAGSWVKYQWSLLVNHNETEVMKGDNLRTSPKISLPQQEPMSTQRKFTLSFLEIHVSSRASGMLDTRRL
jgi:hypothetical protein